MIIIAHDVSVSRENKREKEKSMLSEARVMCYSVLSRYSVAFSLHCMGFATRYACHITPPPVENENELYDLIACGIPAAWYAMECFLGLR